MQALIDELEGAIQNAVRLPVGGKLLMDEATLRRIVEEMRAALPDELRLSQRISGERDRILSEARSQARRMIEEAQAQLNARLEEQAFVQAARQRAREVQQEAEKAAASLRAEADRYVLNQFSILESRLLRILREVQAGERALSQGPGDRTESGSRS